MRSRGKGSRTGPKFFDGEQRQRAAQIEPAETGAEARRGEVVGRTLLAAAMKGSSMTENEGAVDAAEAGVDFEDIIEGGTERGSRRRPAGVPSAGMPRRGVPGSRRSRRASTQRMVSTTPAGAEGVAKQAFGTADGRAVRAEDGEEGEGLHGVVVGRAGAVGVDVADVPRRQPGSIQCGANGAGQTGTVARRAGEVVGICCCRPNRGG